jgi:hypothetical protein
MFIETIQERGYVIKKDIEGRKTTCVDFILTSVDHNIETRSVEKVFGSERNKLVIQPLGIVCIEFLIQNFNTLFDYSYTKKLEEELDMITTGKGLSTFVSSESAKPILGKDGLDPNADVHRTVALGDDAGISDLRSQQLSPGVLCTPRTVAKRLEPLCGSVRFLHSFPRIGFADSRTQIWTKWRHRKII